MGFYSGVDLHSNNCVIGVMDETGKRLKRKRVANQLPAVESVLAPYRDELVAVVVESTYNWYWLVDGLQELSYPVRLAHPAGNKPCPVPCLNYEHLPVSSSRKLHYRLRHPDNAFARPGW